MSDASSLPQAKRKPLATSLGAHLGAVLSPALAARGLSESSLITHWPEIVGLDIARFARFERLNWPPRGATRDPEQALAPATLILRIDGAFAIEAQHLSQLIAERVNTHLGWRCVAKVAFRQGPLPVPVPRRRVRPPSPEALAEARGLGAGVENEGLREALTRFGARVIDRARGG